MYPLFLSDNADSDYGHTLVSRFSLDILQSPPDQGLYLELDEQALSLRSSDEPKLGGVMVDFVGGRSAHRRNFGGSEAVARAVGIKKGARPSVIDATAGLGRDAFVLASLGCEVTMLERHPMVAALLFDGLRRGQADEKIGAWLGERLHLAHCSSLEALRQGELSAEVVYLDPMYPHRKKSAQVKKEMRLFQSLVGSDEDADDLLELAMHCASARVVVKRPATAAPLANIKASNAVETKTHRFDIYVTKSI